jgi:predicted nucleotidyltransferase
MRSTLPDIAMQLGADARTLRRAAERGTVRCRRPGPRSLELPPGELTYLRGHWRLISALTRALRTEPAIELAVLYGSMARGSEHPGSDIDILVGFRDAADPSPTVLARRLEDRIGRHVDVAALSRVRQGSPLLLLGAIDEGRVLVDRGDAWTALRRERETIARAARRHMSRSRRQAAESLASLLDAVDELD